MQKVYQALGNRDIILKRPENTIGEVSVVRIARKVFSEDGNLVTKDVETSLGFETIVKEIFGNASDNVKETRLEGKDPGTIDFTYNQVTDIDWEFTVTNFGKPFPTGDTWNAVKRVNEPIPLMAFQEENSSSNYEGDRFGNGMNGIGAKATNIMSLRFRVEIWNALTKKSFVAEWRDNKDPKIIEENKHWKLLDKNIFKGVFPDKTSVTRVSFIPDTKRFPGLVINSDVIGVLRAFLLDFSCGSDVPVRMGPDLTTWNMGDLSNYAELILPPATGEDLLHKEFHENYSLEFLARPTIGNLGGGVRSSFVNGLYTIGGGTHVDAVYRAILDVSFSSTNDKIIKKLLEQKWKETHKGSPTKEDLEKVVLNKNERDLRTITTKDVEKYVSAIVRVNVINPKFSGQGQTKEVLRTPIPEPKLKKAETDIIKYWNLDDHLKKDLDAKNMRLDFKDSKKFQYEDKHTPANWWKKPKGKYLKAFAVEGTSAKTYADKLIDLYPGGRNIFGIITLRGKFLNVTTATTVQLKENPEFRTLIDMFGLKTDIPPELALEWYLDDNNFETLHYKELIILTDSDTDGFHIRGLLILVFYVFWPSLIIRGFLKVWMTPYLRISYKDIEYAFYNSTEYEEFKESYNQQPSLSKFKYRYLKGLGSSIPTIDIPADFKANMMISYSLGRESDLMMSVAFHKGFEDHRKAWLEHPVPPARLFERGMNQRLVEEFIKQEMVLHGRADNARSLKRLIDGLTTSQRKLVAYAFEEWKIPSKDYKAINAGNYISGTMKAMNYHHGPDSLTKTLRGCTSFYTGSSNIPFFQDLGDFGSRKSKDAAASRYPSVAPNRLFHLIFRPEDLPLLERIEEEGMMIEPRTFAPIVPLILINGANSLGTGWSSTIYQYNPIELIDIITLKLAGKKKTLDLRHIEPWYFNWKGSITIEHGRSKREVEYKITKDYEFVKSERSKETQSIIFEGNFTYNATTKEIRVTEIPPEVYIDSYAKNLSEHVKAGHCKEFSDNSTSDVPDFTIKGWNRDINITELGLRVKDGYQGNMIYLDLNDNPRRADSIQDIMNKFYNFRILVYTERKRRIVEDIEDKITRLDLRIIILENVIANKFHFIKVSRADILRQLEEIGSTWDAFKSISADSFSKDGLDEIMKQRDELENRRNEVEKKSVERMWLDEILELRVALYEFYESERLRIERIKANNERPAEKPKRKAK